MSISETYPRVSNPPLKINIELLIPYPKFSVWCRNLLMCFLGDKNWLSQAVDNH